MVVRTDSTPSVSESSEKRLDVEISSFKEPVATALIKEAPAVPEDCPPDGGLRAWLVVFGVVCGMIATVGLVSSWGAFQEYYQEVVLPDQSASNISWIGSIQVRLRASPTSNVVVSD
uniref:MFS domain-containing protein n=1 Tax=Ganoderma boninense TaxID=34458 RepID=A0A5K1JTF5_9APHY|nr:MFS domain-containing protein [Ganoderma boninense]